MLVESPVKWYEMLYMVSSTWYVRGLPREYNFWNSSKHITKDHILKFWSRSWYRSVTLSYEWKNKTFLVHRLVAEAFLLNPLNKWFVNHKDWNKHNNHVNNLERVTRSENEYHSYNVLWKRSPMLWRTWAKSTLSKKVWQYLLDWTLIKKRDSMADIQREVWISRARICECCKWIRRKMAWGFLRKYL